MGTLSKSRHHSSFFILDQFINFHSIKMNFKYIIIMQIFFMSYMVFARPGEKSSLEANSGTANEHRSSGPPNKYGSTVQGQKCNKDKDCGGGHSCNLKTHKCTLSTWVWVIISLLIVAMIGGFCCCVIFCKCLSCTKDVLCSFCPS